MPPTKHYTLWVRCAATAGKRDNREGDKLEPHKSPSLRGHVTLLAIPSGLLRKLPKESRRFAYGIPVF